MIDNKICEYCEQGLCTYYRSVEEQWDHEQEGIPTDWCDGSEEYQEICFGNGDMVR